MIELHPVLSHHMRAYLGQRRRLARELVARVRRGPRCSLPRVSRGGNPDSDPHTSMTRRPGRAVAANASLPTTFGLTQSSNTRFGISRIAAPSGRSACSHRCEDTVLYVLAIILSTIPLPASHAKKSSAENTGFPYS